MSQCKPSRFENVSVKADTSTNKEMFLPPRTQLQCEPLRQIQNFGLHCLPPFCYPYMQQQQLQQQHQQQSSPYQQHSSQNEQPMLQQIIQTNNQSVIYAPFIQCQTQICGSSSVGSFAKPYLNTNLQRQPAQNTELFSRCDYPSVLEQNHDGGSTTHQFHNPYSSSSPHWCVLPNNNFPRRDISINTQRNTSPEDSYSSCSFNSSGTSSMISGCSSPQQNQLDGSAVLNTSNVEFVQSTGRTTSQNIHKRRKKGHLRTDEKYRTVYSTGQRKILEEAFLKEEFLSALMKTKLSEETGLKESQIKIWFQNRRAKKRRDRPQDANVCDVIQS